MLTVKLVAVGGLKEAYFREAVAEYHKRLRPYCKCEILEIPECRLPQSPSAAQIEAGLKKEGEAILQAMAGHYGIALCVGGKRYTSEGLASLIERTALSGSSSIAFVIGSSHGLCDAVVAAARATLSLSDMTLPHQLCRVVLMEQIYRAFSINAGTKYHK